MPKNQPFTKSDKLVFSVLPIAIDDFDIQINEAKSDGMEHLNARVDLVFTVVRPTKEEVVASLKMTHRELIKLRDFIDKKIEDFRDE